MYIARPPLDSPTVSEISVGGAPSPRNDDDSNYSPSNDHTPSDIVMASKEKPKSFSIADILGRDSESKEEAVVAAPKQIPLNIPRQQQIFIPSPILPNPWDNLRAGLPPAAFSHFIPPSAAQLYAGAYDPRFSLDYQRKLEEHFNVQAHILRQMTMMENSILPPPPAASSSDCGSERSISAPSNCCSPSETNSQKSDCSPHQDPAIQKKMKSDQQHGEKGQHSKTDAKGTPLDALFQMTSKNFDESQDESNMNIFSNRPQQKKKRKSRTAFTNHQIFGLEKRFLYQKYLSPVDRDEIAASLGLTGAQVITWFQNRRAKLKRDIEELKKDVESVKIFSNQGPPPPGFLDNLNELNMLKKTHPGIASS